MEYEVEVTRQGKSATALHSMVSIVQDYVRSSCNHTRTWFVVNRFNIDLILSMK